MKWLKLWCMVYLNDWPIYRVTYADGQRTYPLHYAEAKGCAEVFNGNLWIDWEYAKKLCWFS